jgi:hypothetical protein
VRGGAGQAHIVNGKVGDGELWPSGEATRAADKHRELLAEDGELGGSVLLAQALLLLRVGVLWR